MTPDILSDSFVKLIVFDESSTLNKVYENKAL